MEQFRGTERKQKARLHVFESFFVEEQKYKKLSCWNSNKCYTLRLYLHVWQISIYLNLTSDLEGVFSIKAKWSLESGKLKLNGKYNDACG